ncbi:GMC family oxidoreductase N-terminal domain-containing protein [Rhodoferax sp.]|uniref:GMC family oxidoreductase N-terminal domain-containing protein n=1 Tax=Rhodoferax sp. TaxID=50421 RepID=UPI00274CB8B0|nr:GMC family oxidoreductase [Rhodoferax sp.]
MSSLPDPIQAGLKRGWKVLGGPHGAVPAKIVCDVAIIGSGAGAGITAELLTKAGLNVVIVEEGPLKSSSDFNQQEAEAYPALYQESAARKTEDKAINILQGRCVGGSTTVNWTSSFRTPTPTLKFWQQQFGLADYSGDALAPFFDQAERRLSVSHWLAPPNENNDLLRRGAAKLGIPAAAIARNVRGCWNLGSCGMGCPTNAKQSMLVTTIPAALDQGATLLVETRAQQFELANGSVRSVRCIAVKANSAPGDSGQGATTIVAKHFVLSAGAINSAGLLLRSQAPDPHARLGVRTFLHPVVMSAAVMDQTVAGWAGAPQTIYTDHFLETQPIDGPIGFKLEAPPLHPVIFATTVPGYGPMQADLLAKFPRTHVLLALLRDGFHEQAIGGRVKLRGDGSAVLDYPLTDFVMDGAHRAMLAMAELQFAAGAQEVLPVHEMARPYTTWLDAKRAIEELPMKPLLTKIVSAHVMGGCGLASTDKLGVVRPDGVHWQIDNLSIHDGSIFPTSIGANPQLSIYGIVNRLAQALAKRLTGQAVRLA